MTSVSVAARRARAPDPPRRTAIGGGAPPRRRAGRPGRLQPSTACATPADAAARLARGAAGLRAGRRRGRRRGPAAGRRHPRGRARRRRRRRRRSRRGATAAGDRAGPPTPATSARRPTIIFPTAPTPSSSPASLRHAVERRRTQAALARSAMHDPSPACPTARCSTDRLDNAFSRLPRSGRRLAVLCVALDGFKLVNDSLGHAAGDTLLRLAGERLRTRDAPLGHGRPPRRRRLRRAVRRDGPGRRRRADRPPRPGRAGRARSPCPRASTTSPRPSASRMRAPAATPRRSCARPTPP